MRILIPAILVLCLILALLIRGLVSLLSDGKNPKEQPEPQTSSAKETTSSLPESTEKIPETLPPETEPVSLPVPTFLSDLSAYETYMNPDGDEYLFLVNADHLLDESYLPDDLTDVTDTRKDGRATQKMRLYAAKSLEAFLIEARANGIGDVTVTSAYRSYSYQRQLFDSYTDGEMKNNPSLSRAEAEKITETYSARPGTSEHQSGLCCDMHNIASADKSFAKTEAAEWLKNNCCKFGFILRYPEDKTEITKIDFEPWHFRYIGRFHATKMHESGLCLEEYVESLKGN